MIKESPNRFLRFENDVQFSTSRRLAFPGFVDELVFLLALP